MNISKYVVSDEIEKIDNIERLLGKIKKLNEELVKYKELYDYFASKKCFSSEEIEEFCPDDMMQMMENFLRDSDDILDKKI